MESTHDRRSQRGDRIPLQIAVELGHDDFRDAFAADAQNLSKGGISMRASCLPDLGSRLLCRFQCLPSGAVVTAQGEVVWAHIDGERSGEFGLAFVDLDPRTEWLIEEMIAEQAALGGNGPGGAEPAAQVATLELEGSAGGIEARLASAGEDRAVFEQELDLLRLGRAVRAHAPGASGHGNIAAVELRMVGSVPMLAVTVQFEPAATRSQPELPDASEAHDTEPDLIAPVPEADSLAAAAEVAPDAAESLESSPGVAGELPPVVTLAEFEPSSARPVPRRVEAPLPARSDAQLPMPDHAPAAKPLRERDPERDFSTSFALHGADDEPDFDEIAQPAWHPALTRALRALWHALLLLHAAAAAAVRKAQPHVRGALFRSGSVARYTYSRQVAPQLGALRRVAGQLGRRRRTTAAPGQARPASSSLGRSLLLGLLGAGAAALGVYALAPSGKDEIELHRTLQPAPAAAPLPAPGTSAPVTATSVVARPEPQIAGSRTARTSASTAPDPRTVPSAQSVPAGSPFAVDVRGAQRPKLSASSSLRFGAAEVPRARRFALRMSKRIVGLQGAADAGGFSVTALGGLSLDRAAPISSAHRAVARSMIMNKGDRAELSIRFVDGKQPAYQVSAEGNTLYVLIAE